jgi:AAA+ ATPase superfamily predicted ATPase
MYFDLEPKSRREDLYDFEEPLGKLLDLLKGRRARAPLITITGLRRTGKTSLVRTALKESGMPHLTLNGMAFADVPMIKTRSLLRVLERELRETIEREKRWAKKFLDVLDGIRWLKINSKPPWIHFEWEKSIREFDLLDIVHSLNRWAKENRTKFILVFDEAQEFRRLAGYRLQALMAHIYDQIEGIQMIVTGSQIGFLHDFLGVNDPEAPLYGRAATEIGVPRIPEDLAADFLTKGFEQAGVKPHAGAIELAVKRLDGIIGWLTFFGSKSVDAGGPTEKILEETIEKGSELAARELGNFLKVRKQASKRYVKILKGAARLGPASWTELKRDLELGERKHIADNVFSDLVENLVKGGFLAKNEDGTYSVSDPILTHALRRGLVK